MDVESSSLLLLLPIMVLSLLLLAYCIYDLTRPERRVKGGNKLIWALIIVLGSTVGQLIYLLAGREDV